MPADINLSQNINSPKVGSNKTDFIPIRIKKGREEMFFDNKKFKMVIIDYPIYTLDNLLCATLFGKALKMKFEGYAFTYSDRVLPMDKSDFFGTHIIFCEDVDNTLIPIVACKSVSLDRCLKYNVEFPIISTIKYDSHPSCVGEINKIINDVRDPALISYDSSWAQNLNYRFSAKPEFKEMLREVMMMIIVMHHKEYKIPHMLTCGAVKVKTDQFFLSVGLKKLNEHSHFNQKNLNDEETVIFYTDSFSLEAHRMSKKHQDLWDQKLVINGFAEHKIIRKSA